MKNVIKTEGFSDLSTVSGSLLWFERLAWPGVYGHFRKRGLETLEQQQKQTLIGNACLQDERQVIGVAADIFSFLISRVRLFP